MKKITLIIIFSILILGLIYWNYKYDIKKIIFETHSIPWSENVKIQFKDFKQKPDYSSKNVIYFHHGILLVSNNEKDAYATTYFDKNQSWIKDTTKFDFQGSLKIQRLDFDLLESYTRQLNKEIDKIRYNDEIYFSDLENLLKVKMREYGDKSSELFSKNNMTFNEKEKYWRPIIDKMLSE